MTDVEHRRAAPGTGPCDGKIKWRTEAKAEAALDALIRDKAGDSVLTLRVYRCPFSDPKRPHWHVGNRRLRPVGKSPRRLEAAIKGVLGRGRQASGIRRSGDKRRRR